MFLSSPHRGADLAKTLNRVLQVVSLPRAYVTDLERNSSTLRNINDQFRHLAPTLDIVSFFETRETTIGMKKIVSELYSQRQDIA